MIVYENDTQYIFEGVLNVHPDKGCKLTARESKSVAAGSRNISLTINLPKSLFETPQISATVTVSDEQAHALTIDTEAAADALQAVIGAQIKVEVKE